GFIIGEDPLKLGKCRGETTGVHIKNLTSLDSFGKQPDRQGTKESEMGKKVLSPDQIFDKLRQVEIHISQGKSIALACKEAEISE
ncbi:hypothetical protein, partial [Methylocella sp.]|uniref:hypothetical protein n=1 Tax=Methylocella sp. TaxID=1978226 RepID=UPI003C214006